jgi:tetratricopeptide (TPR) repeat protein
MHSSIVNTLPQKEANLLRKLFKFYETKQYKKGIKQANQILEKFPDHPETNSLKGLFLYQTGEQEEGEKIAKNALTKNVKSELCWHILGIINRSQRNYLMAIACYKNALKYDPENVNILRDLAVLQVHVRELDLHQETRRTLLMNKSNLPVNWVAFAVAEHLVAIYPRITF